MAAVQQTIIPFNVKDFNFGKKLGENSLGDIYAAVESSTRNIYGIKVINKNNLHAPARANQVLEKLSSLGHKNIAKIIGVIEISDKIYILLEPASFGTLSAYFGKGFEVSEEKAEQKAKDLFRQIVTGIHYLHSNKVAHCGLNPTSIMVGSNDTVKLIDAGLGPLCIEHSLIERNFVAPETVNNNYNGFKADIYSLGIIFRYILNELHAPMTPECITLFEKLTSDPTVRPSAGALLKDNWLA
uniref:Protein kinase domain-containing protein n=1 Tax=Panagrolaimus sp. PS1159 TaxID=55785 RepID=A0AC35GDF0_9BILA